MNELIKVTVKNDQQLVSARDLHKALKVTRKYSLWQKDNFKDFIEGEDYTRVPEGYLVQSGNGTERKYDDYALTISMAKELCMMSHTDQGKIYRKYFIELERKWNDPMEVVKRGYTILQNENTQLRIENEEMKPKALFADSVSTSNTTILIGDLAKVLRGNGVNIGQNRLFQILRDEGYLISRKGTSYNMPTQRSMELGLFKIKETSITHSDGHVTVNKTPKVTGKGQQYFINKFLSEKEA